MTRMLAGVEWIATMSLKTPLRSLERHGEVFRGDPQDAPRYGTPAEGAWAPVVDWGRLGLKAPGGREMWSVIGNVPADGGDFLPFLAAFRKIVESGAPIPEKLERIEALCESSDQFRRIARKIRKSRDAGQRIGGRDFAKKFFAEQLTEVPGVGIGTAVRLFDAGFHTLEDLSEASDDDLRVVRGVGPDLIQKIRAATASGP